MNLAPPRSEFGRRSILFFILPNSLTAEKREKEPPQVLLGAVASFDELRAAHTGAAEIRESFDYTDPKTGAKGVRNRKLRRDARTLFTAVFSLLVEVAATRGDPDLRTRCVGALESAIAHETARIEALGSVAMMSVIHWDERMVHAHLQLDKAGKNVEEVDQVRCILCGPTIRPDAVEWGRRPIRGRVRSAFR
jgi:hypothetical protein